MEQIIVSVSDWLYKEVSKLAQENSMTVPELIRYLLVHTLAEKDLNLTAKPRS